VLLQQCFTWLKLFDIMGAFYSTFVRVFQQPIAKLTGT
jgi:hypothetical protein